MRGPPWWFVVYWLLDNFRDILNRSIQNYALEEVPIYIN